MYEKEARLIKRKVFWWCLLQGAWLSNFDIKFSEEFTNWHPINRGIKSIMVSFTTSKAVLAEIIVLPINKEDIEYLPKLFSNAYLRYRKRKLNKSLVMGG